MPGPPVARRGPTSLVAASALAATLVSLAVAPAMTAVAAARPVAAAGALMTTAPAASPAAGSYATDRLLVRFADGAPRQAQAHALEIAGASAPEAVDGTPYVRVAVTGDLTRTIVALSADQAVAEVQRVYRRRATGLPTQPITTAQPSASAQPVAGRSFGPPVIPTDPSYAKSQAANARLMRLPAAWAVRHTSPMIVAVVDTGVDLKHPDLAGRLVPGYDFVENDNKPQDGNGHGTQVAGIIGAAPDNKRGIAGVVWNARIMPVRVLDADGYGFDDTIAKGIVWAANHGASVINLSLGGPEADDVLRTAVDYATRKGALVVVAAGNDGTGVTQYPAAYSSALAVAATDSAGALTQFSSYGDWVDVAAPGWNVLSTALRFPGASDYVTESGTSFSAPYVSGVAALVRAQHPTWTVAHVRRHITATARDAGAPGHDQYYGFGVVDAFAALGGAPTRRISGGASDTNDSPLHAETAFPATRTIGLEGDVDWFRYHATGPVWARVRVTGANSFRDDGPQSFTPMVSMYDGQLHALRGGAADDSGQPVVMDVWLPAAGDYYVSVRNQFPCRSPRPYTVTIAPTLSPNVGFSPVTAADFDTQSGGAAIGDVTGDGTNDLVLSSAASFGGPSFLTVVPGRAGPITTKRTYYDARFFWPGQGAIAIGDVTGDGRRDVLLGTDAGVQLFAQTTRGGLVDKGLIPGTIGGTVAVIPHAGGGRVVAQTKDAGGGPNGLAVFTLVKGVWQHDMVGTVHANEIEVGDLNGDSTPDFAVIDGSPNVTMFTDSGPSYTPAVIAPSSTSGITGLEVADVTGDGLADIITTADRYARKGSVTVMRQESTGFSIGGTATYAGGNGP
ncbi:MAG: hypothetical protein QOJ85_2793, partial [Solirubrobacteraceae bacterium]|nr:hypothetical protein [Solirubrobacteraceae bacterium]